MEYESEIDLSVAIVFFCRPDTLEKTFLKVKKARPSRLFLIQDGPRNGNPGDRQNIQLCRKIVEDIDWRCDVYKNYSNENLGCGVRPYTGITWLFQNTESAVIIEDDCIVADSFFPFCKEMLERYEDDLRVGMITSWNHLVDYDFGGCSYGFSKIAGCGAWATWKNRWEKCDFRLGQMNEYNLDCIQRDIYSKYVAKKKIKRWVTARETIERSGSADFWDHQWSFCRYVNSWLTIVPGHNQICNVGNGANTTHFNGGPKRIQKIFNMPTKKIEFPLTHPAQVLADRKYDDQLYSILFPGRAKLLVSKCIQLFGR